LKSTRTFQLGIVCETVKASHAYACTKLAVVKSGLVEICAP